MSSAGLRKRDLIVTFTRPSYVGKDGSNHGGGGRYEIARGKQMTVSESHRINRKTGKYDSGGPFYTSRTQYSYSPAHVSEAYIEGSGIPNWYSGPLCGRMPTLEDMQKAGYKNLTKAFGSQSTSEMDALGATAISQTAPTNSASTLGTGLAEIAREGFPSLPGIKSWKQRTEAAKAAGDEYLNQVFGWLPMVGEVTQARDAASHSKKIMKNYRRGEGSNTHRRFDFPIIKESTGSVSSGSEWPIFGPQLPSECTTGEFPEVKLSVSRQTKRWFEGCFTYALPSNSDSWRKHMEFGDEADHLYGLELTPDVLWELTPWSWAVDWFSNTGDVINNVTNFGAAGLVLRYGYMMEESIETITKTIGPAMFKTRQKFGKEQRGVTMCGPSSTSHSTITKKRSPANPFGFSVGWEDLSPTQLAITAALGITRFG